MFTRQLPQLFRGNSAYWQVTRRNPFSGKLAAKYQEISPNIIESPPPCGWRAGGEAEGREVVVKSFFNPLFS
jgi:hypothetical protein